MGPHMDTSFLEEAGLDVSFVDLCQETNQGWSFYLPMSQSRLESLNQRPNFDLSFSGDEYQWNFSDADWLHYPFLAQLARLKADSLFRAYEHTPSRPKS